MAIAQIIILSTSLCKSKLNLLLEFYLWDNTLSIECSDHLGANQLTFFVHCWHFSSNLQVEREFVHQREREAKDKQAQRERLEQERLEQRKRLEVQRLTELRLKEQRERTEEKMNGRSPYPVPVPEPLTTSVTPQTLMGSTTSLTKSNSVAQMLSDRIRRGSDTNIKRAESMKTTGPSKPVKRTPSFTTRRRGSLRGKATGK